VSYFLAFLGFVVLVVLHEAGHFAAAKAVGMRVERFSLFFPPHVFKKRRGETEYAIGVIPAGGYVKITGMNPDEQLPDEVRTRAYYAQPPWKRIVVIAAGPLVNFVLAALLLLAFFVVHGPEQPTRQIEGVAKRLPAHGVLKPGDEIVAVDGHAGGPRRIHDLIAAHRCPRQPPVSGCKAARPATLLVERAGRRSTVTLTPQYDRATKSMRVGFVYRFEHHGEPLGRAADTTATTFWFFAKATVALPLRVFDSKRRKEIGSAVGGYEVTRQTIEKDAGEALGIIALISLSLAIINLYPFLPLDGGHIFWAVLEKIRRRPVAFSTMERASVIGFALVLGFFFIGLSNDIGRLTGEGFGVR
jgi:regulator of sigma E protease